MRKLILVLIVALSGFVIACQDRPLGEKPLTNKERNSRMSNKDPKKYNAVEKYVRSPLDQANQLNKVSEDRNRRMMEGLE
jgi:hypothetical protein